MVTGQAKRTRGRPAGVSGGQAPALKAEEMKRLMKIAQTDPHGLRNHAFLQILASGCRVSEPLHIRAGEVVDGQGGILGSFVLGRAQNKSKRARRVYLTESAQKALAAYLSSRDFDPDELLFPLTANYATTLVKRIMRDAGLPNHSSHSLRRSVAHALDDAQVRIQTISQVLGHGSVKVTANYLDCSTVNAERAVANIKF